MLIHHMNAGLLHVPPGPQAACHCLLLETNGRLVLIDTGIGLQDVANPQGRIEQAVIDAAGFQFHEALTVARQIEALGFPLTAVTDIVLTHGDPDHVGGLADFPAAQVHISAEEHDQLGTGHWRYQPAQFAHGPHWKTYPADSKPWFGLEARPLSISNFEVVLVPLFGHTRGHCGVAVRHNERWLLHVGDAYYLRVELANDSHPISNLAAQRADDDEARRKSLAELRRLDRDHASEIAMFGYHDFSEFPG